MKNLFSLLIKLENKNLVFNRKLRIFIYNSEHFLTKKSEKLMYNLSQGTKIAKTTHKLGV